jgi:hypothetical protein
MNMIRLSLIVSALLLGGCVAVPVEPGYYAGPPDYFGPAPIYFAPPPVYVFPRLHIRPHTGSRNYDGRRGSGRGSGQRSDRGSGRR